MGPQAPTKGATADATGRSSLVKRCKAGLEAFQGTKLYDLLSTVPFFTWYGFCLAHQLPVLSEQIAETNFATADFRSLTSLASKIATPVFFGVLACLLALRHKPQAKIGGLYPRFAAVAGTYLSVGLVLLPARELPAFLSLISAGLVLCGTLFAIYVALSLGRSLSMLPQARRLVTTGPYRWVRHPLYVTEAVAVAGITLQYFSPLALALVAFQCIFQLERMKNEERVLSNTFPEYRNYMSTTARLVPGVY
jgi:protein-S-isoprenylcysteine O-methyltransferase Ste14